MNNNSKINLPAGRQEVKRASVTNKIPCAANIFLTFDLNPIPKNSQPLSC